ncbi:MAG: DNA-formamidopyrimidine glycosylase [Candidatus Bathyarchaeota archaeon]|nr:MAG: DNA-formamidopyrimidine glycosylase [Candidatus Bathyarchaeota archaeon]
MPELPEVEMQCRLLNATSLRKTIIRVIIYDDFVIKGISQVMFQRRLQGALITEIARRGKFIIISTNTAYDLVIHLGMTGQITYQSSSSPLEKYVRIIFMLTGNHDLRYHSKRKLGKLFLIPHDEYTQIPTIKTMGLEPLNSTFDLPTFLSMVQDKTSKVKSLLLNQQFIAGIGNIYGDEILFQAGIRPDRNMSDLTIGELKRFYEKIIEVLLSAIHRGAELPTSTEISLIPNRYGGAGCPRCGFQIFKMKIASRTSYYCRKCQK